MNLGDILNEFMMEHGFARAYSNEHACSFHQPRRKFSQCPLCDKRVGRKSRFRHSIYLRHREELGSDIIQVGLRIDHRGSCNSPFLMESYIAGYLDKPGLTYSIADPDFFDQFSKLIEVWKDSEFLKTMSNHSTQWAAEMRKRRLSSSGWLDV